MKTKILMCYPEHFDVNYIINPWMEENINKVNRECAIQQWKNLYGQIKKRADVELINPVDGLPDMVFTANGALCIQNKKTALFGEFANKERKDEKQHFMEWFRQHDWNVVDIPVLFEGAGECLKDASDQYWYGYGFRGTEDTANILHEYLSNLHQLKLVNPDFYHLDTCFCPLTNGEVLYYSKAFDKKSNQLIKDVLHEKAISVSDEDAYKFACNAVCIENTIIVNEMSNSLKSLLWYRTYNVICTPLTEFLKSGGGAKCLTLQLQ